MGKNKKRIQTTAGAGDTNIGKGVSPCNVLLVMGFHAFTAAHD